MFKKLLLTSLVVLCILAVTKPGDCATDYIKTYTVENDTASQATTYVSTSTIVPNQTQIYGWSIAPTRASSGVSVLAILWDMTSATEWNASSLLGESETAEDTTTDKAFWFPRRISNQLKVVLGPYSAITIEYTR